jgi:hypothetical protein
MALVECWRIRSPSVRIPRIASHASNGAIVPPVSITVSRSIARPSRVVAATPPV